MSGKTNWMQLVLISALLIVALFFTTLIKNNGLPSNIVGTFSSEQGDYISSDPIDSAAIDSIYQIISGFYKKKQAEGKNGYIALELKDNGVAWLYQHKRIATPSDSVIAVHQMQNLYIVPSRQFLDQPGTFLMTEIVIRQNFWSDQDTCYGKNSSVSVIGRQGKAESMYSAEQMTRLQRIDSLLILGQDTLRYAGPEPTTGFFPQGAVSLVDDPGLEPCANMEATLDQYIGSQLKELIRNSEQSDSLLLARYLSPYFIDSHLSEKLQFEAVLEPDGTIKELKIISAKTSNPIVIQSIKGALRTFPFPKTGSQRSIGYSTQETQQ